VGREILRDKVLGEVGVGGAVELENRSDWRRCWSRSSVTLVAEVAWPPSPVGPVGAWEALGEKVQLGDALNGGQRAGSAGEGPTKAVLPPTAPGMLTA